MLLVALHPFMVENYFYGEFILRLKLLHSLRRGVKVVPMARGGDFSKESLLFWVIFF